MSATRKLLTTTPASSSTRVSRARPTRKAMRNTSNIDTTAPMNAATGSAHTVRAAQPVTTVSTAPAAAPLAPPST